MCHISCQLKMRQFPAAWPSPTQPQTGKSRHANGTCVLRNLDPCKVWHWVQIMCCHVGKFFLYLSTLLHLTQL